MNFAPDVDAFLVAEPVAQRDVVALQSWNARSKANYTCTMLLGSDSWQTRIRIGWNVFDKKDQDTTKRKWFENSTDPQLQIKLF